MAAYSFENGSGSTLSDVSGTGNHGTIIGATWTTEGHVGKALSFNGSNNWVRIADAPSLDLTTGMTLEAWVYPTALTGRHIVVLKQQLGQLAYALYANTDSGTPSGNVFIDSVNNEAEGILPLPLNTWSHLATTYDGTRLRFYVNGVRVRSLVMSGLIQTFSGSLRIGGNSVWGEYFSGRIDEMRIYNRALTTTEILTDMQTAVSPASEMQTAHADCGQHVNGVHPCFRLRPRFHRCLSGELEPHASHWDSLSRRPLHQLRGGQHRPQYRRHHGGSSGP